MNFSQEALKSSARVALAALLLLLIGAIVYYKERALFADAAFLSFNIINYKSLAIQWNRYGSIVSQVFPWLGVKMHLPLKAILMSYSISFNVFSLLVGYVLYLYKEYFLTILTALFYLLFFSDSYFWVSEIPQAIGWMFLFLGTTLYLGKKQSTVTGLILFLLLGHLTISTHFVAIIPITYLWGYLIIEQKNWPFSKRSSIVLSLLLIGLICLRFVGVQSGENAHLHGVTHFSLRDIIDSFSTPVVAVFLGRCITNYWIAVIVFIAGISSLLKNKQTLLAVWTIIFIAGFMVVMGLTYGSESKNVALFHIESEWQAIGIIAAAPFVFSFLPRLKPSHAAGILAIVVLIRLAYIVASGSSFTWRTHFTDGVLAQMKTKGITKLALYNDDPIREKDIVDWGLTYESLYASSINGDKPARTFCFVNKDDKKTLGMLTTSNGFYDAWGMTPSADLNARYFVIDSTRPYQIMTYTELFH
jgi:hypothetical protein